MKISKNYILLKKHILLFVLALFSINSKAQQQKEWPSLKQGDMPSKYIFKDIDGVVHSLEEFRGNFVLIDVWASWCSPCIQEFPALDSLRHHYKNKNLVVLGISQDHLDFKWRGAIQQLNPTPPQWTKSKDKIFETEFGITYIPRLILIGPNGRVVNEKMPKASNKEIYKILDDFLR